MCVPGHFALLHNAQGVRYFITLKHPLIRCQKTCRFGTQAPLPSTRCKHRPGKTRSWILASRLFKATLAIIRAKPACFLAAHPRAAGGRASRAGNERKEGGWFTSRARTCRRAPCPLRTHRCGSYRMPRICRPAARAHSRRSRRGSGRKGSKDLGSRRMPSPPRRQQSLRHRESERARCRQAWARHRRPH